MASKSDYCYNQAKPFFDKFKSENPKLTMWQLAEKIRPLISKMDGGKYSMDVIIKSLQGRDRVSTVVQPKLAPLDGASTAPASTIGMAKEAENLPKFYRQELPASLPVNDFCFDIEVPPSIYNPERFYNLHIPKDDYKLLLLYDIHIPFHDEKSLALAIRHGKDQGVDEVFIMGDGVDFHGLSKFEKRKAFRDPKYEVITAQTFLKNLRRFMPKERITWKEGNHEYRLQRYLMTKAQELEDFEGLEFQNIMCLADFGAHHIENKTIIKAGKLNILHGHELPGGGENVARNKMKRAMANIIFGHSHLSQSMIVRSIDGSHFGSWGVGALCHRSPDYNPFNQWLAGFAIVTLQTNGNFLVENKIIIDGQIRNG